MTRSRQNRYKSRYKSWFILGITLVLFYTLAGAIGSGCSGNPDRQTPENENAIPQVGGRAPNFSLPDLEGQTVNLQDYQGEVILLNFWTTWCRYCVKEMDLLESTHLNSDQVKVITVNVGEKEALPRQFIEEKGFTFPVLLDQSGELFQRYGLSAFPSTLFISKDGTISSIWIGALDRSSLEGLLKKAARSD